VRATVPRAWRSLAQAFLRQIAGGGSVVHRINPAAGRGQYQQPSTDKLVDALDKHVAKARESLSKTNDDFLMTTNWRLLAGGKVVSESPRHVVLRDTLNHLAHHRGQLTVYLRLNDQTVPAIYGPSADDQRFA
jgi:uncharacterized damage-inducible protein DinB